MTTAATIYMSLLGPDGLKSVAIQSHNNTDSIAAKLSVIEGVERVFDRPIFHELLICLNKPVANVVAGLAKQGIVAGTAIDQDYPELGNVLLVCVTETKTAQDIEHYITCLEGMLGKR